MSVFRFKPLLNILGRVFTKAMTGDPISIAFLAAAVVALIVLYRWWLIEQARRSEKLRLGIGRGGLTRTPLPTMPLYTPLEPLATTHNLPSTNPGPTP